MCVSYALYVLSVSQPAVSEHLRKHKAPPSASGLTLSFVLLKEVALLRLC